MRTTNELANIESLTLADLTPAVCAALVKSNNVVREENVNRIISRCRCGVCGGLISTNVYSFKHANAVILGFGCHGETEFASISIDDYENLSSPVDALRQVVPWRSGVSRPAGWHKQGRIQATGAALALPEGKATLPDKEVA